MGRCTYQLTEDVVKPTWFHVSVRLNPFLNVVRALACSELDNPKVRETLLAKRIFFDDGFDVPSILADGQDDPAISRYLSTRDQEVAGSVVLLQKNDMRRHMRVNCGEVGLVDEFNDEHRRPACIQTNYFTPRMALPPVIAGTVERMMFQPSLTRRATSSGVVAEIAHAILAALQALKTC